MAAARPTTTGIARARIGSLLVLVFLVASLLVPQSAGASAADENAFVAGVNATRAEVGLPPLQVDNQLVSLARGWAGQMRDGVCGAGNHICHASPISAGVTHNWAKLGENVGTGGDVPSVMAAFIASPGHYANIVDPDFTHIGVGVVWQDGRLYTTHRFMSLQNAPAPTTAAPTTTAPTTTAPPATAPATPPTTEAPSTTTAPPARPAPAAPSTDAPAPTTTAVEQPDSRPTTSVPPVDSGRATVVVTALARLT